MSWFWRTEQENNFLNALEKRRLKDFLSDGKSILSIEKNNKLVIKGSAFFASVQEMQSIINPNPVFWNGFIKAAADALNHYSNEEKIDVLYSYLYTLEKEWGKLQNTNQLTSVNNSSYHTLGFAAGACISAGGTTMLFLLMAGSPALLMWPWGAAVVAVAIILIGLAIAAHESRQVYTNIRAVQQSQLEEIRSFVLEVDSESTIRENRVDPINLQITKNYGESEHLPDIQAINDDGCTLGAK